MPTTALEESRSHSKAKLSELREALKPIVPPDEAVVTCGSYARQEASPNSDIDFFVITKKSRDEFLQESAWIEPARNKIREIIPNNPAEGGAFDDVEYRFQMLQDIGGNNDTNYKITRRMLLLLEGDWLANESALKETRHDILSRYIGESMTDHQLALFLLNDIIRYYRTMAVDYEFKTIEGQKPKPWAIRNIKLIFSRKLLYASGLFSVAQTSDRSRERKIEILERLFDMTAIDRMADICGSPRIEAALKCYSYFLKKLADPSVRAHLDSLDKNNRDDQVFRELKNEGHHFTRELSKLFETTFDGTNPIRRAVVF